MDSRIWQYVGVVISGGYLNISGFGELRLKDKKDGYHKLMAYVKKNADPAWVLVIAVCGRPPANFFGMDAFLSLKGIQVRRVNPKRVSLFAKESGLVTTNEEAQAGVLVEMAKALNLQPRRRSDLTSVVITREFYSRILSVEASRLELFEEGEEDLQAYVRRAMKAIEHEAGLLDERMDKMIASDPALVQRRQAMRTQVTRPFTRGYSLAANTGRPPSSRWRGSSFAA